MPKPILDIQQHKRQNFCSNTPRQMGRKSETGQIQKFQHHCQKYVDSLQKYTQLL